MGEGDRQGKTYIGVNSLKSPEETNKTIELLFSDEIILHIQYDVLLFLKLKHIWKICFYFNFTYT